MYYYKSAISNKFGVDNPIKKAASLITFAAKGVWLHHTFMVFECFDQNHGTRKFSLDYDKKGLLIKYDERVLEERRDTAIDYE